MTTSTGAGPLSGIRVIEAATGRPARIAAMLLADLGADVVRVVDPTAPPEPLTPDTLCWDRGKRIHPLPSAAVASTVAQADVALVDAPPSTLSEVGWDADTLRRSHPELVHIWLPPYGVNGEWQDLPEDPLLLAALSGVPLYFPADDDSPVAPVGIGLTYLHGAIGAAAAVAGLVGRQRQGVGTSGVITGLHAVAALMGTALVDFLDGTKAAPQRDSKGGPNWRLYECADGRWLHLAALTPDIFFRALEVVDRLDLMAHPAIAGDWQSVFDLSRGRPVVTAALEPIFASEPSDHWLAKLRAARVPCAVVQSRSDWLDGPIVRENHGRRDLTHLTLGPVTMPNVPIIFGRTPVDVRGFGTPDAPGPVWPDSDNGSRAQGADAADLPLAGVQVVDGASFLAGPSISTLLADFGADVVRIEPPGGDTYRTYSLSFLALNQRKRGIIVDLKQPDGVAALHALLAEADIYVENLRPHALADLGLADDQPTPRFPNLVHCSVSAFGRAEAFADIPGFDPVLQTVSGMAAAQGPDGHPIVGAAPINDVSTGALGALGSLAALYHRLTGGPGQRLWVSLAASSTFVQSGEFTSWPGSPPPPQGDLLYRGPDADRRYYACRDGWLAVAAVTPTERAGWVRALDGAPADTAMAGRSVADAIALLLAHGVPACRVVMDDVRLDDPFLVANEFSHLVAMPEGTARVVTHLSSWPSAPEPRASRFFAPGDDTEAVFAELKTEDSRP